MRLIAMYGMDLLGLLLYYKAAIRKAKADKRQGGFNRNVILRQILVREIV